MPLYVDGYVVPVPRRKVQAYRRIAAIGGIVFVKKCELE
jgi:uncharacterized protein YbaA (DUF1428 family)